MGGCRFFAAVIAVLAGALIAPPVASATFHLMKVREVYPGPSNDSYVVLQMYASGQQFVGGHSITVHDAAGDTTATFTFPAHLSNGQNQATILVADSGYKTAFPDGPDPDGENSTLNIPSAGGAVCFDNIDCVSWGSFAGSGFSTGSPASPGGVTAGKALHRSIAPNCSTLLEVADDTNDSSTDFFERDPEPRSNSSPIVESNCVAPQTTITSASVPNGDTTNSTAITFSFTATPSEGASFKCKLDNAPFELCTPPQEYTSLDGDDSASGTPHSFQVRATNADGTDPTPATHSWTVDTVDPTMTITDQPDNPSSGASAAFTYQANESVASTQCRLDTPAGTGTFESCPVGSETYSSLSDGLHTFIVRATDLAGNQGTPAAFPAGTYTWEVDNDLADEEPPETTITSMPPNPSDSSTATFEYSSNEPGSTFQCKLDGSPFVDCPATGITYTGLTNGSHTFQVRAIDPSGNEDPTPAGYTFDVSVFISEPADDPPPSDSDDSDPSPDPTAEPVAAGTAFAARVAPVRGAIALLRTRCRGQQGARCKGVARLILRVRVGRGNRKRVRNIVIGRARYNLPAGRPLRTVRVRLNGRGKRLLRRAGRRGFAAILVGGGLKNRVVTLKPVKRRANRRRGARARQGGERR